MCRPAVDLPFLRVALAVASLQENGLLFQDLKAQQILHLVLVQDELNAHFYRQAEEVDPQLYHQCDPALNAL